MNYLIGVLLFLIFAAIVVVCIDVNRFVVRNYTVYSDKIDRELDIVLLTDLHDKKYGTDNYKLIDAIRKLNPDIICAAGDMITAGRNSDTDSALRFFSYLSDYKIYYGIGNHEHKLKLYPDIYGLTYADYILALKEMGIYVLENEHAYIDDTNIRIQGLMIGREYYEKFKKHEMTAEYIHGLTGEWSRDDYCIMLAHDPEYFEAYAASGADLTLSGHVHGGLVRLPGLGGLISPKLKLFPKYDGGIYECSRSQMILSRGLGYHTIPLRFLNPGELIQISLRKQK